MAGKEEDKHGMEDSEKTPLKTINKNEQRNNTFVNMSNHRLYRSAVRPFFCCGSQFSLNSISEFIEIPQTCTEIEDTEYVDISDEEEETDLMNTLSIVERDEIKLPEKASHKRSSRRKKSENNSDKGTMRKKFFTLKLRGRLQVQKSSKNMEPEEQEANESKTLLCTSYRRTSDAGATASGSLGATGSVLMTHSQNGSPIRNSVWGQGINFDELYPTEDIDEQRIAQRAREMEEGIDVNDIWIDSQLFGAVGGSIEPTHSHRSLSRLDSNESIGREDFYGELSYPQMRGRFLPATLMTSREMLASRARISQPAITRPKSHPLQSHSQVDYIHCLVPDINDITNCSFYWGVMDRYQAEQLLDNKPEGTFLLRDSAQEEFLFSVSFRRYGRSLHARIEQWNHKFSFDSHDPGVFASESVCGLIEHYKDPNCCMFFEPMLTIPLHRSFPFSLQHLCRAAISDRITYDSINLLPLPRSLKEYITYYHYKQKVRIRRFDLNS